MATGARVGLRWGGGGLLDAALNPIVHSRAWYDIKSTQLTERFLGHGHTFYNTLQLPSFPTCACRLGPFFIPPCSFRHDSSPLRCRISS